MKRPLYKRVWIWVSLVIVVGLGFYLYPYITYQMKLRGYAQQSQAGRDYIASVQKSDAELEVLYKADTYGGVTPQETLKLFIDALEKKDYVLASKYVVVEKQDENLKKMPQGVASGSFVELINTYKTGTITFNKFSTSNEYEADIIPKTKMVGFYFRFILNKFTKIWKISG